MMSSQSWATVSRSAVKALRRLMPAQFTRIEISPAASATCWATLLHSARFRTSSAMLKALWPASPISLQTVAAASAFASRMKTAAPWSAKPFAMARPMPEAPPVTAAR